MHLPLLGRVALVGTVVGAMVLPGAAPVQAAATGSITGQLTTSASTGAADVYVQVYQNDENWTAAGWTHTDAAGNYTVGGLATGSYLVGFFPAEGPDQYYHQKSHLWDADPVSVVDGAATTVDEQLRATGSITGQILDAAGNPVPDISIRADATEAGDYGYGMTDAEGRYRMTVLPGRYAVSFQPIADSYQGQYVPQKLDIESATQFEVAAGSEVVANDTVLATGSLSGRFTTETGQPLVGAYVDLATPNWYGIGVSPTTDSNGEFTVPAVLVGSYTVGFVTADWERFQYYDGKLTWEEADLVTVQASQTTRITDSFLATGSVRVSAVDANTGAVIPDFCVEGECSNGTGKALVTGLPQGRHTLFVYTETGTHYQAEVEVEVQPNTTVDVTVRLQPGARITTTIIDRQTGSPVSDVCVGAMAPGNARLADGYGNCSDSNGKINIGPLEGGDYRLFALPTSDSGYGLQWVGASGGTGDERSAVTVQATVGATVVGPQVKLDRAGSIAGRVTDAATGAPIAGARANVLSYHPGSGPGIAAETDEDGYYKLDRLGPYEWPLLFTQWGYAPQWSGGVGNRYEATKIKVTAGGTATHDTAMVAGSEVKGSFTNQDGAPIDYGHVMARNAVTGDIIGMGWMSEGQYSMRVLGGQAIYLTYNVDFAETSYQGRYPTAPSSIPRRTTRTVAAPAAPTAVGSTSTWSSTSVGTLDLEPSTPAGSTAILGTPRRPVGLRGVLTVPASGTLTINVVIRTS